MTQSTFTKHASHDNRRLFHFELTTYRDEKRERSGVSVDIYASDKKEAIQRFVRMFTPTTRFECTDVSEHVEDHKRMPFQSPFVDCISRFNGEHLAR